MKIAIFIDGGYLNKILKNEFSQPPIDFSKVPFEVCKGKEILRTYYYNCLPYQSNPATDVEKIRFSKAQKFYSALERLPHFEVRMGRLVLRGGEFEQKRVDTLLSIDLVNLSASGKISDAVLVAGDGDYIPAVKTIKDHGTNITLYHSQNKNAYDQGLWQLCDDRYAIDINLINKIKRVP